MNDLVIDVCGAHALFDYEYKYIICDRKKIGQVLYTGAFCNKLNEIYNELKRNGIDWRLCSFISSDQFNFNRRLYVDD